MKAFCKEVYGGPEVLQLREVEKPVLEPNQILVNVKANSANPADWHILRGKPILARIEFGLFKPKSKILGADFAGIVEAVGSEANQFKIGDRVFGESLKVGAFAEYMAVEESICALMPPDASFAEMACVPIAGLTAYQAIVTHGKLQAGESVLINGSSGGVGHLSVQIAKAVGGKVTAICSSRNSEFVGQLGADQVIAYDRENVHEHQGKYNLVLDTHGNLTFKDFKRMGQRGVLVGFTTMSLMIRNTLSSKLSSFPLIQFTASVTQKDLNALAEMIRTHQIKPFIEKTYPYTQIPDAIGYIEAMRTRGKVAMVWE